jgi:hypothetical protein
MDTFNDAALTPEQIKMLTLQFMGQHVTGDLKELDKNLVAKNNTLQGMILNPTAVINSIPSTPVQTPPPQSQPQLTVHNTLQPDLAGVEATNPPVNVQPAITQQPVEIDQNQLEFNFETSPLSERIFDSLQRLEKRLSFIEETLLQLTDTKKKD